MMECSLNKRKICVLKRARRLTVFASQLTLLWQDANGYCMPLIERISPVGEKMNESSRAHDRRETFAAVLCVSSDCSSAQVLRCGDRQH